MIDSSLSAVLDDTLEQLATARAARERFADELDALEESVRRIADGLEAALDDEHADRQYAAEKTLDALRALVQS